MAKRATVEELLAEAAWLGALAKRLAGDEAAAEDLVQETWSAALRKPPDDGKSVRPWLATVLRNAARMKRRADLRRAARETACELSSEDVPTPEALLERAQTQRVLAELVLRLEEPYRSTVLLHFFEGMALADIARSQDIAASTARWRLKTALDQLRTRLDAESGGRRQWSVAFLAAPSGVIMAEKTKIAVPLVLILLLIIGGGVYVKWFKDDDGSLATIASGARDGDGLSSKPTRRAERTTPEWLVQAGVKPQRIAGTVVYDGAPVHGAIVELASLASEGGLAPAPRVTTDETGAFDFGIRPAKEWSVRAIAPHHTPAVRSVDLRHPARLPAPDKLVLKLGPCDSALFGSIVDASGGPIAGAKLARIADGRESTVPGGAAAISSKDGGYELCVKPSHPFWMKVRIAAAGYGAIAWTGSVVGRFEIDFELVPEATIIGRVIADEDGAPISGAHVFVPRGDRGLETNAWRGSFTDDAGRFRIDGVAPGPRRLVARASGRVPADRETIVTLEAGETLENVELRMTAGARVRGVVKEDGKPVAGARVAIRSLGGLPGASSAVSQHDGSFELGEVPFGAVRFTTFPFELVSPQQFIVDANRHDGVVLNVEARGRISGRVHRENRPIAGARIDIFGPNSGELGRVHTDEGGHFDVSGLAPGPWTLFASSQREGAFGRAPEVIELESGESREVDIELAFGASIAGVVLDQDNMPVAGVAVEFIHTTRDDRGTSITSSDGTFKATTMSGEGEYRAQVRSAANRDELLPAEKPFPRIALEGPNSAVTGVVLRVRLARKSIRGLVVDSSGGPVADVRVAARRMVGTKPPLFHSWIRDATTTTNQEGRFEILDLAESTYALQARTASGMETVTTNVEPGAAGVRIVLPEPGRIEGQLVGFQGTVAVSARASSGSARAAKINGDTFSIADLKPGNYVVSASSGEGAASVSVGVNAGTTTQTTLRSNGSGKVTGRVVEFRTGRPIQGMTCSALPRSGDELPPWNATERVRTDSNGRFEIETAPAGDILILCSGLWHLYSDGLRTATLERSSSIEVEVPAVAWQGDVVKSLASLGAEFDRTTVLPRLVHLRARGPAATAGLQEGDVITTVDGTSVAHLSPYGVRVLITNRPPGTQLNIEALRGEDTKSVTVTLGEPAP